MKTFIILTFGFLGFAFYEMSGGSDFAPASERQALAQPAGLAKSADIAPKAASQNTAAAVAMIDETPSVTRVSLNLTTVNDAVAETMEPTAKASPEQTSQQVAAQITPVSFDQGSITSSDETPAIILPSLIATTPDASEVSGDIRTVSANRVNVRGGPSTSHGVVGKLTRGDEVRILEDNGDGWVRMETLNGGETGWMADFLLTSG